MDLLNFQKPGRYLGNEWNLPFSTPSNTDFRICLCFPEQYELGMSNLGFRIIYQYLNSLENISCERCFFPGEDLINHLGKNNIPISSLETKTPLKDFDLIGFSINHELNFLNFLKILKLGKIPLKREKRKKPLVAVGALNNPEPIAEFTDFFFLGEIEDKLEDIADTLKKSKNIPKKEKLIKIAETEGVYVPQFYRFHKHQLNKIQPEAPFPLKRTFVKDLNSSFQLKTWSTPYIPIVFDRLQIETQRGCPHTCKFCQARKIYSPYREKNASNIIDQAINLYERTGYETISLTGLSVVSHSKIESIVTELIPFFKKRRVSITIPSIRPSPKAIRVLKMLNFARRPALTIALETGTNSLRKSIGKTINMDNCHELMRIAANLGYRRVKFYFMLGLPGETEKDILAIGDTLVNLGKTYKKERGKLPQINTTVSYFIPKPFSLFQNHFLVSQDSLQKKKNILKKRLSKEKYIKLNFSDYNNSFSEFLLSRSDRSISPVLAELSNRNIKAPRMNKDTWDYYLKKNRVDLESIIESEETLPKHIEI